MRILAFTIFILCLPSLFAQQQVNNFRVLTNLTVSGSAYLNAPVLTNGTAVSLTGSLTNVAIYGGTVIDTGDELQDTVDYSLALTPNGDTATSNDASARPRSVATIASLVSDVDPLLVPMYARVSVLGYHSAGDGGGGDFRSVTAASGTTNTGTFFTSTHNNTYAWERIWDGTTVDAAWFGAMSGDDADDSPAIQDAINLLESLGRGNLRFGGGVYDIGSTIRLKYRVNLLGEPGFKFGEGFSFSTTNALFLTGGITQWKVMDGANCDALWMYATNGYVRQASETIEDGSVYDSRFQDSTVKGIVFNGNSANNSNSGMAAIRAMNKWTINIDDCGFISWRGPVMMLWDVNASTFRGVWAKGNATTRESRGIYVYSSADNIFETLYIGGFQGPALTFAGESTFKNLVSDVIAYNSFATNTLWEAVSVDASGVFTFGADVPLASGMPVELRTTGALPTPFTDTQLYWSVRLTGTTFGVHTNYALATNGTYLACSGGSGTHSLTIGPATGLYLTYNAKYNNAVNYRSDQMSGPGIALRNTRGNALDLQVTENTGVANGESSLTTKPAGAVLEKDADDNLMTGTTAAQTYGVWLEGDATRNQFLFATNNNTVAITNASSGFNYTPSLMRLDGYLGGITTAEIGSSANGTSLTVNGGAGGVGAIKLVRAGSGTNSIGMSGGTVTFKEDTQNRNISAFVTDGSTVNALRLGATSGQSSPRQGQVVAEDSSGTDVSGANLTLRAGLSTGSAASGQVQLYASTPGSSGSTPQSSKLILSANSTGVAVVGDLTVDGNAVPEVVDSSALSYSGGTNITVTVPSTGAPHVVNTLATTADTYVTFSGSNAKATGELILSVSGGPHDLSFAGNVLKPATTTIPLSLTDGTWNLEWKQRSIGGTNFTVLSVLEYDTP